MFEEPKWIYVCGCKYGPTCQVGTCIKCGEIVQAYNLNTMFWALDAAAEECPPAPDPMMIPAVIRLAKDRDLWESRAKTLVWCVKTYVDDDFSFVDFIGESVDDWE